MKNKFDEKKSSLYKKLLDPNFELSRRGEIIYWIIHSIVIIFVAALLVWWVLKQVNISNYNILPPK